MLLKLITYNLLYGGRDGGQTHRLRLATQLLQQEHPDIVLLQECEGFADGGGRTLHELEAALGMRGFLALAPKTQQHLAILLRAPLRPLSFQTQPADLHHALATLELSWPGAAAPLTVVDTHLCPFGPLPRRAEAAMIIGTHPAKGLMLLAGDFNATSHHDAEPEHFQELAPSYRMRHLADDLCSADRSVMRAFELAGWVDLGHRFGDPTPTVLTKAFPDCNLPRHRSDYVLASPELAAAARRYAVLRNVLSEQASDHYPVMAEFELSGAL